MSNRRIAKQPPPHLRGLSLITVALAVLVVSVVAVSVLPGQDASDYNKKILANIAKLDKVEEAMTGFMAANGRRPCPADGQYSVSNANYGVEAPDYGTCTGSTPAAPMGPDAGSGHIVAGTIPTRSLGLSDDYAIDAWGRRFTYVVDKRATVNATCHVLQNYPTNNGTGDLTIENTNGGTVMDNTMYAYLSYGPDGHGAFPAQGSTVAGRINKGSTDTDTLVNAGVNSSFTYNTTNFTKVKIRKDRTTTFDDLLYYRPDIKNTCCISPCTPIMATLRLNGKGETGNTMAMGDINGDGYTDLVIGAFQSSLGGCCSYGSVYVVFGTKNGFPDPIDLTALDGTNGFRIDGVSDSQFLGYSVAVGDVDGDNTPDIVIGAVGTSNVYIIKGVSGQTSWSPVISASSSDYIITGGASTQFGRSVAIGDINNDTHPDIIVGTIWASQHNTHSGSVYVVYGGPGLTSETTATIDSSGGTLGFRLDGTDASAMTGMAVASGDINGDGKADVIVSSGATPSGRSGAGEVYVVFGNNTLWPAHQDLTAVANGTNGFMLEGAAGDGIGSFAVGDVNGDNVPDLLLGAPGATQAGHTGTGKAYVLFGWTGGKMKDGTTSWPATLDLNTLASPNGFNFYGSDGDYIGMTMAAGDVNGDNIADIATGSLQGAGYTGVAFLLFGHTGAWSTTVDLPSTGIRFNGVSSNNAAVAIGYVGSSLFIGDLDGNGLGDLSIGAIDTSYGLTAYSGSAFVYFGKKSHWASPISLGTF